jgi:hypothetical protein
VVGSLAYLLVHLVARTYVEPYELVIAGRTLSFAFLATLATLQAMTIVYRILPVNLWDDFEKQRARLMKNE